MSFLSFQPHFKKEVGPLLRLSGPIALGLYGQILIGVVDSLMIGQVGVVQLAASSVVNGIVGSTLGVFAGMAGSIGIYISERRAHSQAFEERGALIATGLLLFGSLALGAFSLLRVLSAHFEVLGQSPAVTEAARPYLNLVSLSLLPFSVFLVFRQLWEGLERSKIPMLFIFGGIALNAVLNGFFIYGWFGFPAMGLEGAGWATLFTRGVMALGMLLTIPQVLAFSHLRPSKKWSRAILKLGIPAAAQVLFETCAFMGAGIMMGWTSEKALAAYQVTMNIASLTFMGALGLSIGVSVRVAEAIGRGEHALVEARHRGRTGIQLVLYYMSICAFVILCTSPFFPKFFVKDAEVQDLAMRLLWVAALFQLVDGLQVVTAFILRSWKDTVFPTLWIGTAYWVVSLPLGYGLVQMGVGPTGIFWGLAVGLALAGMGLVFRLYRTRRI